MIIRRKMAIGCCGRRRRFCTPANTRCNLKVRTLKRLLDKLFTKDITKVKVGRCGYGLACYEDGGLLVDGILLRLEQDKFWYAQADGDFYSWARAHAAGMDVRISDPDVFVSQVQGPNALKILAAASDNGMPEPFGYFAIARVSFGGQEVRGHADRVYQ